MEKNSMTCKQLQLKWTGISYIARSFQHLLRDYIQKHIEGMNANTNFHFGDGVFLCLIY